MMAKILGNFRLALLIGIALLVAVMVGLHRGQMDATYWTQFSRFFTLRRRAGDRLLYYFNFVQTRRADVPADLTCVTKYSRPSPCSGSLLRVGAVLIGLMLAD